MLEILQQEIAALDAVLGRKVMLSRIVFDDKWVNKNM